MLNDTSIFIVFLVLGVMAGYVLPGFIGYLSLLYRRVGFSLKLLTRFLRSLVLFLFLVFIIFLSIVVAIEIFEVPDADVPPPLALGLGLFVGIIGGCIALFVGFLRVRKRAK